MKKYIRYGALAVMMSAFFLGGCKKGGASRTGRESDWQRP